MISLNQHAPRSTTKFVCLQSFIIIRLFCFQTTTISWRCLSKSDKNNERRSYHQVQVQSRPANWAYKKHTLTPMNITYQFFGRPVCYQPTCWVVIKPLPLPPVSPVHKNRSVRQHFNWRTPKKQLSQSYWNYTHNIRRGIDTVVHNENKNKNVDVQVGTVRSGHVVRVR